MQTHHFSGQVETIHSDNSKVNHRLLKDNEQLRKRIAELEYELKDKGRKNSELFATNNDLRSRIKELEADAELDQKKRLMLCNGYNKKCERVKELEAVISKMETTTPKWISVEDRLPNEKEQYELLWVGYVRTDNTIKYVYEASFDYYTKQFYTENDWGDKTFISPSVWMVIPSPPTTKESPDVEKEK